MDWRTPGSVGYQYVNALLGNQVEYAQSVVDDTRNNFHPSIAYDNEPYIVYKTYHATPSGNIPPSAYITANIDLTVGHSIPANTIQVDTNTINTINADDQEAFFHGIPTRLTYDPNDDVSPTGLLGSITGLAYVKSWSKVDASGVVLIPEQDVYIVNQDLPTPVAGDVRSTVVYDSGWNILDSYDYGLGYQDYDHTGKYEVITNPSGYTLEYNPISSAVSVYDYVNLDASGNSQVISSDYYTLTSTVSNYRVSTTIAMSGVNPYNNAEIGNSNYFIEYRYRKYDHPDQVTTQTNWWKLQRQASPPVMVSSPVNYYGTTVTHEIARSPSGNAFALRVDPRDIRPGSAADIKFDFISAVDAPWDHTAPFSYDLSADSTFLDTASGGAHVYWKSTDITQHFSPVLSGTSQIYIPTTDSPLIPPPNYTVRMYYNSQKVYSGISAVQSFSTLGGVMDPYPQDYTIENEYLVPHSILPISDASDTIQLALLASRADQFEVVTDLLFSGIAYDRDKDCYWMLEARNLALYKIRPADGSILGKWNIFKAPNFYIDSYKSMASGVIDRLNDIKVEYPFISHDRDDGSRSITGCVYMDDFLYIASYGTGVVGGTGIYRMDTYNERTMDMEWNTNPAEVYPHFPLPFGSGTIPGTGVGASGIVDITLDDNEDFLVAETNVIKKLGVHYDYTLIDSDDGVTRGMVFYGNYYPSGVTVTNFPAWGD